VSEDHSLIPHCPGITSRLEPRFGSRWIASIRKLETQFSHNDVTQELVMVDPGQETVGQRVRRLLNTYIKAKPLEGQKLREDMSGWRRRLAMKKLRT
jgi:hypothetical protein